MDPKQLNTMAHKFQSVLKNTVLNDRGKALGFSKRHWPPSQLLKPAAARPSLRKPVRRTRTHPALHVQTAQSRVLPYCEPLWQAAAAYPGSRHRWRATWGCPGVL